MSHTFPEGSVLYRNLAKNYPVCTHGKGVYLYDDQGRDYFDASGGALVVSLGHGNAELAQEIFEQMSKVAYVSGMQFTSPVLEEAASRLTALASPLGLDKVAFLASGSEAIEAAIKFARQLWVDRGVSTKHKLISRTPGYHGNTLYALSASGRPHYKKIYGPLLSSVVSVSAPYGYRAPFLTAQNESARLAEYHEKGADFYAHELEAAIAREGPDTISAFILEPVSGSSTGSWVAPDGYFDRVQDICARNKILIIADEVMCGAGRTGKFFACEHYGFKPDILVMGKGLNAGLMPVSAVLVRGTDVEQMRIASGSFMHAQTYMQSPSMAATANAVLKFHEKNQVLARSQAVSKFWLKLLHDEISPLPTVGCVTGIGHMAGVEFVAHKTTREPFPIAKKFAQKFVTFAQDQHGIVVWPNYGQADGVNGDLVMLGPSLLMTEEEARECVMRLKRAIFGFSV